MKVYAWCLGADLTLTSEDTSSDNQDLRRQWHGEIYCAVVNSKCPELEIGLSPTDGADNGAWSAPAPDFSSPSLGVAIVTPICSQSRFGCIPWFLGIES